MPLLSNRLPATHTKPLLGFWRLQQPGSHLVRRCKELTAAVLLLLCVLH
jgi:hypothetical protein